MAQGTIDIATIGTKTLKKGQVAKDILSVAEADYKTVLRGIAAQEIAAQQAIGNNPTNIIVDGKKNGSVSQANYSVVAYFVDSKSMVAALNDVWRELHSLARRITGRTAGAFEVWASEGPGRARKAGNDPSAVNPDAIGIRTGLYAVGPMVSYTRKYQWLYGHGPRKVNTRRKKYGQKGVATRDRPKVPLTIHEQAARNVQRKYPWLRITDAWLEVPNQNPSGSTPVTRVPGVGIWSRRKGRL